MPDDRHLRVYLDSVPIGSVRQTRQGALGFAYDEYYRETPGATPLSLSMPLAVATHPNKPVRAYLDGLLPDSEAARQRWASQYGVSPNNPFALLRHVGRDAAGAVQILPPEVATTDAATRNNDIEWLSDDDFAVMVHDVAQSTDWNPGRMSGRWSLAGAQPKVALVRDPDTHRWGIPHDSTPTTHVVKPAIRWLADHHINEALCLRTASEAGLRAADVDVIEVADVDAVVSRRYDRTQDESGRWLRVHQEDLCQALAVHPSLKYQSDGGPGVGDIGDLLARLSIDDRTVAVERFFKSLAFNVLIGGTDAHAKNYSLLLAGSRVEIAPLYDVASAVPYEHHTSLVGAMKIGDHWNVSEVTDRDWGMVGRRLGLPADQAVDWVHDLRRNLPAALERAAASLPADPRSVAVMAERITEHVNGTRRPT